MGRLRLLGHDPAVVHGGYATLNFTPLYRHNDLRSYVRRLAVPATLRQKETETARICLNRQSAVRLAA